MDILTYLFWPNPGNAAYDSPKVMVLFLVCAGLVLLSIIIRLWRKRIQNSVTKKLSRSWPVASLWFGLVGLFLVVCRVESISYLSMRVLWLVWILVIAVYLFLQIKLFRARHYTIVQQDTVDDPREKYLPGKKKK